MIGRLAVRSTVAVVAAGAVALTAAPAWGATINVACSTASLVAAINTANANGEADTLELAPGCDYNLTAVNNTTGGQGANGLPVITSPITIHGNRNASGVQPRILRASGSPVFRLLFVTATGDLTLSNLGAGGGSTAAGGAGGNLYNSGGKLTLREVGLATGTAAFGGGIASVANGTLTIAESSLFFNTGTSNSGALALNTGTATITRSSLWSNTAPSGSALVVAGNAILNMTNVTVSNNVASAAAGAAVWNFAGTTTLTHGTVANNTSPSGTGGLRNTTGAFTVRNTIVSTNGPSSAPVNCDGALVDGGHNLAWPNNTGCPAGFTVGDPKLGALVADPPGSWTYVRPLTAGSAAIDIVPATGANCAPTDERGVARPQGPACDAGAYEAPDTTAPDTVIDSGPSGLTNDSTPTFTFHSTESGSTFECAIDAGEFAPCSSPHTTASLSDGEHTFRVRAKDAAGNTDQSPATRTFTVDATPPDTEIDSGPSGLTNDSTPTFTFHSTESGSTFECAVDDGDFAPCDSPHTTAALADGEHTFRVRATDAAGNTDPTPAQQTFTVDTTPPQTTITSGPSGEWAPGKTNDSTPTFTFESNEPGSTFECSVDGGAWQPCESPYTTPSLADGQHSFRVRATDPAGNTDPTPAERTFVVEPRCTLVRLTITLAGEPIRICLIEARAAVGGEAAAAPRIVSVTAKLVRGRHTYASATTRGTKRPVLRTRRTLRPGYYVVKVVARTEDGRRLTGRSSVRLTKSLARKLRRR